MKILDELKLIEEEQTPKEIIEVLRNLVIEHDLLYREKTPIITDEDFDEIYMKLEEYEEKYPEFYSSESPTQKVTDIILSSLTKVKHNSFMGSLDKAKTKEQLDKFLKTVKYGKIVVQHKLDGLTIVLRYENGTLIQAITRGSGEEGEDVTHTIKTISNIPKKINYIPYLELRMEAVIPFLEFERINKSGEYSNPRNLVSGTVRQLDNSIAKERKMKGIVFDLIKSEETFDSTIGEKDFLEKLGFEFVETVEFEHTDIQEIIDYCFEFGKTKRSLLEYGIDGLVLKANENSEKERLGSGNKNPKWGLAFKFKSLEAYSILTNVDWTVGRTGKITPRGTFNTVEIDGAEINKASLHNIDNINSRKIKLLDKVLIARNNDVIPQIIQSVETYPMSETILEPINCPVCNVKLGKVENTLTCLNDDCQAKKINQIINWCSKCVMDINLLGEENIEKLYEQGIIKNIVDIYCLENKKEEFIKLPGFGKKSYDTIIKSRDNNKNREFYRFLMGLSIKNIGESSSKNISKHFGSIDKMIELSKDEEKFKNELLSIKDVGNILTESVIKFLKNKDNINMINDLKTFGINVELNDNEKTITSEKLKGLTFVITGELSNPRKYYESLIEKNGGKKSGSVSSKTTYLLAGESPGSNLKKAQDLGVKIISEEEFLKML